METPTLDKIQKVHEQSQAIGTFLDWLGEKGITLCHRPEDSEYYWHCGRGAESLLYEYFGIDEQEAEKERRALLDYIRKEKP